jgi:hypothetical protein
MEFWQALWQIVASVGIILRDLANWSLEWFVLIAWLAWWLAAARWRSVWPVLARGGWVLIVLINLFVALVWSRLEPGQYALFGVFPIGNYLWHLGATALITLLTLLCGWLQGILQLEPSEVVLEPAPVAGQPTHHPHEGGHEHGTHADLP